MERITAFGTLCFVALVGLSIGSVSCLPAVKNAKTSVSVLVQPKIKSELDLKVEGVYYEGQIIKYLSYMNYDSWEFNGTRKTQLVEKKINEKAMGLGKYIKFVQSIPQSPILSLSSSSSILAAGKNTTTCKDDIRVRRGNSSFVWGPHKMNQTFKELLSQCDRYQWSNLLESGQGKVSNLNSCLSGIRWANSSRPRNFTKPAIRLYTIYVSTTDHIMILNFNPLVNFDVFHFVYEFPFDLMETKVVVTLCGGKKNESLKRALRNRDYVVQEDVISSSTTIFVKKPKGFKPQASDAAVQKNESLKKALRYRDHVVQEDVISSSTTILVKKPKGFKFQASGAAVPGKHVGYLGVVVALLIGIVGSGMGLQFGMF